MLKQFSQNKNVICSLKRYIFKTWVSQRCLKSAGTQLVETNFKTKITSGPSLNHFIANSNVKVSPKQIEIEEHPYINNEDISGAQRRVYIETYGCQMNVNDTEIAWSILLSNGFVKTIYVEEADVILIMTCSIREGAEQKIWNRLDVLKSLKKKRKKSLGPLKIGILGCMAERLKKRLIEKERMVDIVAGPDSYRDLPRLLSIADGTRSAVNVILSLEETYADVMPVRVNEDSRSAFVSIMRGCNNLCSYCIVPFTRGRERSRQIDSILDEVRYLSDQGLKEVTILGQNVNSYQDRSEESEAFIQRQTQLSHSEGFRSIYKSKPGGVFFADLLDHVSQINPEMRIRFTSPHPKDFPDEVLDVIKSRPNICNQIHLPAQSGNSEILEKMNRGYTREAYLELVDHIKNIIPNIAFSSDFITGFCGETEEQHQDTLSLLKLVEYNNCFIFAYSLRQLTKAHLALKDDIPQDVKIRRVQELFVVYRQIALKLNQQKIGEEHLVLIEGTSKRGEQDLAGRNDANVKVIIPNEAIRSFDSDIISKLEPGEYVATKIVDCSSQVLKGIPLYKTTLQEFHKNKRTN